MRRTAKNASERLPGAAKLRLPADSILKGHEQRERRPLQLPRIALPGEHITAPFPLSPTLPRPAGGEAGARRPEGMHNSLEQWRALQDNPLPDARAAGHASFVAARAVRACGEAGDWKTAQAILAHFDKEPQLHDRRVAPYSSFVLALCSAGKYKAALQVLQRMRSLQLDARFPSVYVPLLEHCGASGNVELALQIASTIASLAPPSASPSQRRRVRAALNQALSAVLTAAHTSAQKQQQAVPVQPEAGASPVPIPGWLAADPTLPSHERPKSAAARLNTFAAAASSLADAAASMPAPLRASEPVLDAMLKAGLRANTHTVALLTDPRWTDNLYLMRRVLSLVAPQPSRSRSSPPPAPAPLAMPQWNDTALTVVLSSIRSSCPHLAIPLLLQAQQRSDKQRQAHSALNSEVHLGSEPRPASQAGAPAPARGPPSAVFSRLPHHSPAPSAPTAPPVTSPRLSSVGYATLDGFLRAEAACDHAGAALWAWRQMVRRGWRPSVTAHCAILGMAGRLSEGHLLWQTWEELLQLFPAPQQPPAKCYAALARAAAASEDSDVHLRRALAILLSALPPAHCQDDKAARRVYHTLLRGMVLRGSLQDALTVLDGLVARGFRPTPATLATIVHPLPQGRHPSLWSLVAKAKQYDLPVTDTLAAAIVSSYERTFGIAPSVAAAAASAGSPSSSALDASLLRELQEQHLAVAGTRDWAQPLALDAEDAGAADVAEAELELQQRHDAIMEELEWSQELFDRTGLGVQLEVQEDGSALTVTAAPTSTTDCPFSATELETLGTELTAAAASQQLQIRSRAMRAVVRVILSGLTNQGVDAAIAKILF